MGQQKRPHLSSDKLIWSQIYRTLKEMLKFQQFHIETLINDREFLENNIYIQQEHWSSRARFLESHITQMKDEQAKTLLVEDAKMGVLIGFKESEALCYKMQLELAESDLEEFRSCVEVLSAEMEELKEKLKGFEAAEVKNTDYTIEHPPGSSEDFMEKNQLTLSFKKEKKKLKHAYRNLSSRRDTEVSALLAEKDFVWNQFKKMESDLALFKSKRTEADHQAMKAAEKLQDSLEKLQLEINEKDEVIVKLETERSILELDVRKHAEESEHADNKMKRLHADMDELRLAAMENEKLIDYLRKELSNLKTDLKKNSIEKSIFLEKNKSEGKSKSGSITIRQIHLQRCSKKRNSQNCDPGTSKKHTNSCGVTCETPASDNVLKRDQTLTEKKRRFHSPVGIQPSLFHSDFKVPKLKRSRSLLS